MDKKFSLTLASILCSLNIIYSQDLAGLAEPSLIEEAPTEIIKEVIGDKSIYRRDVFNFLSRLDKPPKRDYQEYLGMPLEEIWISELEKELNKDPFFYAWEKYKPNDLIIKNQVIASLWSTAVIKYPSIFGKIEEGVFLIKDITTLKTPKYFDHSLRMNLELSPNNSPRVKARIISKNKNSLIHDINFRITNDSFEIAKKYSLESLSRNASFEAGFKYSNGEQLIKATLKIPYWFGE